MGPLTPIFVILAVAAAMVIVCLLGAIVMRVVAKWLDVAEMTFSHAIRAIVVSFCAFCSVTAATQFYLSYVWSTQIMFSMSQSGEEVSRRTELLDTKRLLLTAAISSPLTGLLAGASGLGLASLVVARILRNSDGERLDFLDALSLTTTSYFATSIVLAIIFVIVYTVCVGILDVF